MQSTAMARPAGAMLAGGQASRRKAAGSKWGEGSNVLSVSRGMCSPGNITSAADEWGLAEGVDMLSSGSAQQQLEGMKMVISSLKGVPVLPVPLPEIGPPESDRLDAARRVWHAAFDDPVSEEIAGGGTDEEGQISELLSFGDIHIDAVFEVLSTMRALNVMRHDERHPEEKADLVCWDLASGDGKASLALALLHPFQKVVGVEEDPERHAGSYDRLDAMPGEDKVGLLSEVQLVGDLIMDVVWPTGDFITVNGSRLSDHFMMEIAERCQELAPGAVVVSYSRRIATPLLTLVDHRVIPQVWGDMSVYIQQRVEDDSNASKQRVFPLLPPSSDSTDQRLLREAGVLPLLVDLAGQKVTQHRIRLFLPVTKLSKPKRLQLTTRATLQANTRAEHNSRRMRCGITSGSLACAALTAGLRRRAPPSGSTPSCP